MMVVGAGVVVGRGKEPTNDGGQCWQENPPTSCEDLLVVLGAGICYDFKRFRQSSTVVGSKVRGQMSLEECKS